MDMTDDRTLINRIQQGDKGLYREVMRRYTPLIYNKVLGITHNEDDAKEATQQCFIKAYDRLGCWNGQQLGPWLTTIALHTALDLLSTKKRRRGSEIERSREAQQMIQDEYAEEREHLLQRMEEAIRQLPKEEQGLIKMHYYQKLKSEEMARRTGLSQSNVLVKLHRIREKLKKIIGGQDYE